MLFEINLNKMVYEFISCSVRVSDLKTFYAFINNGLRIRIIIYIFLCRLLIKLFNVGYLYVSCTVADHGTESFSFFFSYESSCTHNYSVS